MARNSALCTEGAGDCPDGSLYQPIWAKKKLVYLKDFYPMLPGLKEWLLYKNYTKKRGREDRRPPRLS
jgi:hypothetical protein